MIHFVTGPPQSGKTTYGVVRWNFASTYRHKLWIDPLDQSKDYDIPRVPFKDPADLQKVHLYLNQYQTCALVLLNKKLYPLIDDYCRKRRELALLWDECHLYGGEDDMKETITSHRHYDFEIWMTSQRPALVFREVTSCARWVTVFGSFWDESDIRFFKSFKGGVPEDPTPGRMPPTPRTFDCIKGYWFCEEPMRLDENDIPLLDGD